MPLLTTLSLSKNPQVHFLMKKEGRSRFIFVRCHRTLRWSIPKRDPRRFHSLAKRIRIMCISANKSEKVIYVRICEWWIFVNWLMCCYWKIDSWEKKMYKPLHLYVFEFLNWNCDCSLWFVWMIIAEFLNGYPIHNHYWRKLPIAFWNMDSESRQWLLRVYLDFVVYWMMK